MAAGPGRWMSRRRCARWSAAAATRPTGSATARSGGPRCTPHGPATLALRVPRPGEVHATAWGPGRGVGGRRRARPARRPGRPGLVRAALAAAARDVARRHPGLRVPRTGLVFDALLPAILEQKVTGTEARQAWRFLLHRYGTAAPGPAPAGMRVPPPAPVLLEVPTWDWHKAGRGHQRQRADPGRRHRRRGGWRSAAGWPRPTRWPGCRWCPASAVWTAAETAQRALGDADALSVGDFHIHDLVGWALLGHPLSDEGMVELLGAGPAAPAPGGPADRALRRRQAPLRPPLLPRLATTACDRASGPRTRRGRSSASGAARRPWPTARTRCRSARRRPAGPPGRPRGRCRCGRSARTCRGSCARRSSAATCASRISTPRPQSFVGCRP